MAQRGDQWQGQGVGARLFERCIAVSREMGIDCGRLAVVVNRLRRAVPPPFADEVAAATGADAVIGLPDDGEVAERAEAGTDLLGLDDENPVAVRLGRLLDEVEIDRRDTAHRGAG